jgi:hypothetical protein
MQIVHRRNPYSALLGRVPASYRRQIINSNYHPLDQGTAPAKTADGEVLNLIAGTDNKLAKLLEKLE